MEGKADELHLNVILPAMELRNSSDYRRIIRHISCLKDSKTEGLGSEFRIQDSEIWDPDLTNPSRSLVATIWNFDPNYSLPNVTQDNLPKNPNSSHVASIQH